MSSHASWSSEIDGIVRRAAPAIDAAVERSAGRIRDTARVLVPVGAPTTHIRSTIRVRSGRSVGIQREVIAGSRSAFYSGFVEFGTVHLAPRPFMTPAALMESASGKLRRDIKDAFND